MLINVINSFFELYNDNIYFIFHLNMYTQPLLVPLQYYNNLSRDHLPPHIDVTIFFNYFWLRCYNVVTVSML